jgi:PTH1 family peptidyl-tRNA hydrolase
MIFCIVQQFVKIILRTFFSHFSMKIVVGLGNPGKKYTNTKHNAGFIAVDKLAQKHNLEWEENKKFDALIAKGQIREQDVLLAKPQTFMNNSGTTVSKLVNFYNVPFSDLTIIHDDVDLEPGKVKYRLGASSAGHHGVEDIIEKLGSKEFWRLRIGVGRPETGDRFDVKDFVLSSGNVEVPVDLTDLLL